TVVWNGQALVALWAEYPSDPAVRSQQLTSLSFDGANAPAALLTDSTTYEPAAAFNGTNLTVTWAATGEGADIRGAIVDGAHVSGAPFTCSTALAEQASPALAGSLAVWIEPASDTLSDVFAARANASGGFGGRVRVTRMSALIPPQA